MFVMPSCYNVGDTVYFPFDSYDSNRASVTITGLAVTDIEPFRCSDEVARASDNGYTLMDTDGIDLDGRTGIHGFKINTGENSHVDFWDDGETYFIFVDAITVDGQTVRFTYLLALGLSLRPTTAGRTLTVESDGVGHADVKEWLGTAPLGLNNQRVQVDVQAIDGLASAATVLGLWLAEGVQTVADSGTTTTLVDAVLTQADGYWNGALLVFRSGTNAGRTAIITDFDAGTDTLTFAPAVPDAVTTEGYVLIPGLGHADADGQIDDIKAIVGHADYGNAKLVRSTTPANALDINENGNAGIDLDNTSGTLDAAQFGADFLTTAKIADGAFVAANFAASSLDGAGDWNTVTPDAVGVAAGLHTTTDATVAALNNISAGNVLTQVNAALDAAISELGVATPSATPSLRTGMMLMYMALRNKLVVQTSGTDALEVYNDAGTKVASKLLTDDGSDYTEAKMT